MLSIILTNIFLFLLPAAISDKYCFSTSVIVVHLAAVSFNISSKFLKFPLPSRIDISNFFNAFSAFPISSSDTSSSSDKSFICRTLAAIILYPFAISEPDLPVASITEPNVAV